MNTPIKLSVSSILLAGILAGCSQQQIQPSYTNNNYGGSQVSNKQQVKVIVKTRVVEVKRSVCKVCVKKKTNKKNIGLPPAKPGQCYAKVKLPPTYKTLSKKVLLRKASSKRVFVRGAQYRWINKRVLVRAASYTQRVIPAQYKTVTKRVMVKPSYLTWKKGKGLITRIDNSTGEILCRVKIPAIYKNVSRKVLVRAAQTIKSPRPAVYKNIKVKTRISPAQYKTVRTPARYKTKNYRVKTSSAKYVWRQVVCQTNSPKHYKKKSYVSKYPKYKKVAKSQSRKKSVKKYKARKASYSRKMASPTRYRKSSFAKANTYRPSKVVKTYTPQKSMTKSKRVVKKARSVNKPKVRLTKANAIFRIQTALSQKGFHPGRIDGKLGPGTVSALTSFQRQNGLPTGKLNRATLRALNLI